MKRKGSWKNRGGSKTVLIVRLFSQISFLLLFLFLFIKTDYSGADQVEYAVNILFRIDPFLATVTMLATKTLISLMAPSLIVLLLALVLGRSFCGWVCPMGTVLDGCRGGMKTDKKGRVTLYPLLPLWILLTTLFLAFFGFHIAGYVDPFSILVRGLAQAVYPSFHGLTETFFTFTYHSAPDWLNSLTEPIYEVLKATVLPVTRKYYHFAWLSLFLLIGVIALEAAQKRFFCRNICPLGAILGLVSGSGLMRAAGGDESCGKCRVCSSLCRMGAIGETRAIDMTRCNLCMECQVQCPRQVIGFGMLKPRKQIPQSNGLSRRQFLGALGTGVALPAVKQVQGLDLWSNPQLIRPPGALPEKEFLGRCVRCAECVQVCIGNGLQLTFLEGGLDAIFTPKLGARMGYCEYNCTLCGQVCPTGALKELTIQEKHQLKIGHAWFDKNSCLPYAKGISCMVCEEHCPTPEKAIQFKEVFMLNSDGIEVTVKQPFIIDDLCIGCGICEFKCPIPGRAAIVVTSAGEHRNPAMELPNFPESGYY